MTDQLDLDGLEGREVFVPIDGQSFACEQTWINRATRALTSHPQYRNTEHGEHNGWRGPHFTAMCFDQAGNRMRNGGDFKRATAEGTYPVWWIWPDQIPALITRLRAAEAATAAAVERAERAERRCVWMDTAAIVLAGYERDYGERLDDMHELGRIDESRDCPSFRIRVGHIRPSTPVAENA